MRHVFKILAAGIGAALSLSAAAQAQDAPLTQRLDAAIDRAIADRRIVGTVVVVMQDGKVVYRRAAGQADREAGRAMEADAIFRLASVSKPIVTAAALALVDQGRLKLDDPVTKWLPDFRPKLADGATPVITVRQLMTHTAGLSYGFFEPEEGPYHRAGVSDGLDAPELGFDEELRRISKAGLVYRPGTRWAYSLGIDVLGAVVAKASGEPLPAAVEHLVTGPLGMPDTGFAVTDRARLATPYADGPGAPVRMGELTVIPFAGMAGVRYAPGRVFDKRAFPSGGAGMVGTADDLARLLEAVRAGSGGVLRAPTARSMMQNQTGDLEIVNNGPGWAFGFGGAVVTDPVEARTPQSAGTWTWGGAYGHNWFVDPARKLVVVAFTNTALEGMSGAYTTEIRDAVYGAGIQAAAAAPVRLYAMDCGRLDIDDMGMFSDTGEHAGEKGVLAAPCFLIRHPKGDLIWDTGLGDRLAKVAGGVASPGGRSTVTLTLQAQLAQLGLKPADIRYVALSHMHADHAGNAALFPNATWLVDPVELKWALSKPTPLGVDPSLLTVLAKAATVPISEDHDVFGDGTVRILKTPGHTPGHKVLVLKLAEAGTVILSGDLFHSRENYERSLVPPVNVSRADTLASFGRVAGVIRQAHARLVVQHDRKDFEALPKFPAWLD